MVFGEPNLVECPETKKMVPNQEHRTFLQEAQRRLAEKKDSSGKKSFYDLTENF